MLLGCPYLGSDVELTDERLGHIGERYPECVPDELDRGVETIRDPDFVIRSRRSDQARSFVRWFDSLRGGTNVVVVVVSDAGVAARHWIITGYVSSKLLGGEV